MHSIDVAYDPKKETHDCVSVINSQRNIQIFPQNLLTNTINFMNYVN